MTDSIRTTRLLLAVVLLAGLLLAGRTALAIHHYDHDLAQPNTECKFCDLGQHFKNDLVHVSTTHAAAVFGALRAPAARSALILFAHTPYIARAPPSAAA